MIWILSQFVSWYTLFLFQCSHSKFPWSSHSKNMSIRLCDGIFWFPWHRLSTWHRRGSMASAMAVRQRGAMARNAKRDVMVPVGFFHGKITMLKAVKMGDLPWIFWGLVHKNQTSSRRKEEKSLSKSRVDRHFTAPAFSDALLSLLELAGHIPTSTWEHLIQYWMNGWMDASLHVYIYI